MNGVFCHAGFYIYFWFHYFFWVKVMCSHGSTRALRRYATAWSIMCVYVMAQSMMTYTSVHGTKTLWNKEESEMFSSSNYFIIVLLLNCITLANCFLSINQANIVHRDVTSVSIQKIKFPSGSPRNALPSSMYVTLSVRGQEVTLNLLRNTDLQYSPTPILASREKVYRERVNKRYAHYQDSTTLAAVEMECHDEQCKRFNLFGTLFIHGELVIFQKQPTKEVSSSEVYDVIHSSTNHINRGMNYVIPNKKKVQSISRKNKPYYLDRRKRATGTYTLELLLVIDYSLYKYWYDKQSTSGTEASRRAAAIDDIKRYCAFFINGIDLRFHDLTGGNYKINAVFAGIYIMETLQQSPFNQVEGLIDAETALHTFSQWINNKSTKLPGHDHAMIITRLNLMLNGSPANRGHAFSGTMCSSNSQSVVEDDFDFMTQTVAAHEIGHGLNASHDGDENSCLASAGYIMVATLKVFPPSDNRRQNPWKFSSCSVNEMSAFIDTLSSNCLRTTEAPDTTKFDTYTATPIGQKLTPDTQCLYKYGTGSYFGRLFYNESTLSTICTSMYCSDPTNSNFYGLMVPGHGTSCGSNKWCSGGQCIASSQAPALSGTCPFGDSPGIEYNGKNCSEYIKSSPWSCYTESVYRTCCTSCNAIRTSISDCQFGDRRQQCTSGLCHLYPTECCWTCYTGTTFLPTLPTTMVPSTTLPTTKPITTTVMSSSGGATAASMTVLFYYATFSITAEWIAQVILLMIAISLFVCFMRRRKSIEACRLSCRLLLENLRNRGNPSIHV